MRRLVMLLAATAAIGGTASAQPNFNANPSFGTIALGAGFDGDPRIINVTAGGRLSAQSIDPDCRGSVANAPDVRLNYEAGSLPLIISVDSDADTTLAVNGPDGTWYCDDDTNGTNPVVRFNSPQSGRYDIYVGHYQEGSRIPARLYISEVTSAGAE
ncbi:MAG TPA: hypothetical protein VEC11_13815 [Allosphingosinicella sp.]|nr:hypothetical protein [Allosphingosinicella sp.]